MIGRRFSNVWYGAVYVVEYRRKDVNFGYVDRGISAKDANRSLEYTRRVVYVGGDRIERWFVVDREPFSAYDLVDGSDGEYCLKAYAKEY